MPQSGAVPGLSDLYVGCIGSTQYRTFGPAWGWLRRAALQVIHEPAMNAPAIRSRTGMTCESFFIVPSSDEPQGAGNSAGPGRCGPPTPRNHQDPKCPGIFSECRFLRGPASDGTVARWGQVANEGPEPARRLAEWLVRRQNPNRAPTSMRLGAEADVA